MRGIAQFILSIFLFFGSTFSYAQSDSPWFQQVDQDVTLNVDLFLSTTCPHCQKADAFFKSLQAQKPWINVSKHYIDKEKTALEKLNTYREHDPSVTFNVPAVFFCNSYWQGFHEANDSGKRLSQALSYCRTQLLAQGHLTQTTVDQLRQSSRALSVLYAVDHLQFSSFKSFLTITGLSILHLCVPFTVLALFCFIYTFGTTVRGFWTIGLVFLGGLALANIFQMHFVSPLFLRVLAFMSGFWLILSLARIRYTHFSQGKFFLIGTVFTAFCIQLFQQTCTPYMPVVFAEWLKINPMSWLRELLHYITYLGFYLIPYILFIFLANLLQKTSRFKQIRAYTPLFYQAFLSYIALLLIVYPSLLASTWSFLLGLIFAIGLAWYKRRTLNQL